MVQKKTIHIQAKSTDEKERKGIETSIRTLETTFLLLCSDWNAEGNWETLMPPEEAIKEFVRPPAEKDEVTPEKPDDNLTKLFLSNKHT